MDDAALRRLHEEALQERIAAEDALSEALPTETLMFLERGPDNNWAAASFQFRLLRDFALAAALQIERIRAAVVDREVGERRIRDLLKALDSASDRRRRTHSDLNRAAERTIQGQINDAQATERTLRGRELTEVHGYFTCWGMAEKFITMLRDLTGLPSLQVLHQQQELREFGTKRKKGFVATGALTVGRYAQGRDHLEHIYERLPFSPNEGDREALRIKGIPTAHGVAFDDVDVVVRGGPAWNLPKIGADGAFYIGELRYDVGNDSLVALRSVVSQIESEIRSALTAKRHAYLRERLSKSAPS